TFEAIEDLINLHQEFNNEFENALNTEHAAIWQRIVDKINNDHPIQISGRQCQIKWNALVHGYEN
ncbi:9047_t:CDS:1, partial [Funneliformis geosporum]